MKTSLSSDTWRECAALENPDILITDTQQLAEDLRYAMAEINAIPFLLTPKILMHTLRPLGRKIHQSEACMLQESFRRFLLIMNRRERRHCFILDQAPYSEPLNHRDLQEFMDNAHLMGSSRRN